MKKSSIWLMAIGIIGMVIGCLLFRNLNYDNAVDSHNWTININGIKSFPWLTFSGFVIFTIGIIFYIATWEQQKAVHD
jgi:hypothetical protein